LHLALDLGNTTWKLAFATGHTHAPRLRTMPARDPADSIRWCVVPDVEPGRPLRYVLTGPPLVQKGLRAATAALARIMSLVLGTARRSGASPPTRIEVDP
jgi:hypothetical protein